MVEHIKRQLAAQGIAPPKGQKPAATPRTPLPAPKEPREPTAAVETAEIVLPGIPDLPKPDSGTPGGPCIWYLNYGRTSFSLAGDHFGERYRLVLTLPKDPALLRALLDTAATYYATRLTPITEFVKP